MVLSGWDSTCSDNESRMYSLSQAQQMSGAEGLRDARNNIQFLPSPLTGQYAAQGLIYVDKMQAGLQQPETCPRKPGHGAAHKRCLCAGRTGSSELVMNINRGLNSAASQGLNTPRGPGPL